MFSSNHDVDVKTFVYVPQNYMWCKNVYQRLHMQHTEKEPLAIILIQQISCVFCRFDANQHSFCLLFIIAVFGGDCTEWAEVWTCFFI